MHQRCKNVFRGWAGLVGWKPFFQTALQDEKEMFAKRQCSNPPRCKGKPQLKAFLPKKFMTRFGDYEIREAVKADKAEVLSIRQEAYAGLDFLPDYYDKLVSAPNGKAFLVQSKDRIISFVSAILIDDQKCCYGKGFRTSEEYEKRHLLPTILDIVADWGKSNGAPTFVGTITDPNQGIWHSFRPLSTMFYLIHLMQLENICLLTSDINSSNEVFPLPFSRISTYIRSSEICKYLFPYNRIVVDLVPYRLIESNVYIMEEVSSDHIVAFSDVHFRDNAAHGLLSFGTIFRGQKVNYVYCIEIYGSDINSVKKHIARHISYLKQRANGIVCVFILSYDNFPQKLTGEICHQFGMKRVNYSGTPYPHWNFQIEVLVERLSLYKNPYA